MRPGSKSNIARAVCGLRLRSAARCVRHLYAYVCDCVCVRARSLRPGVADGCVRHPNPTSGATSGDLPRLSPRSPWLQTSHSAFAQTALPPKRYSAFRRGCRALTVAAQSPPCPVCGPLEAWWLPACARLAQKPRQDCGLTAQRLSRHKRRPTAQDPLRAEPLCTLSAQRLGLSQGAWLVVGPPRSRVPACAPRKCAEEPAPNLTLSSRTGNRAKTVGRASEGGLHACDGLFARPPPPLPAHRGPPFRWTPRATHGRARSYPVEPTGSCMLAVHGGLRSTRGVSSTCACGAKRERHCGTTRFATSPLKTPPP